MAWIKSILGITFQNFRKWKKDYRIITIAIVLFLLVQSYVSDMQDIAEHLNTSASLWTFPFLYSQFYMKLVFTIPLVFLFCDAPFQDSNYLFVIVRSGRIKWAVGEIFYIILASAIYYIYIFLLTIILALPHGEFSLEWGKTINTISQSNIAYSMEKYYIECSSLVVKCFTPLQAVGFTFFMSWLCGCFIGLLIFFLNNVTGKKIIGITVSSLFVVFSILVANGGFEKYLKYSPVSWNTLNLIDVGGYTQYPVFSYCCSVLLSLCGILVLLIILYELRYKLWKAS